MRPKFAKDNLCVEEPAGFDVFVRILESLMELGSVGIVEPVPWIERQQIDFGSFGQVGGFVNDQPAGLHAGLQCHTDHSSTAQRRATRQIGLPSTVIVG
jgi:hypothetical protein